MGKLRLEEALRPAGRSRGGIRVPHQKNTATSQTVEMPPPERVVLPMQQHIGAACTPIVKPGEHVFLGQKIGDSGGFVSAPVHASVSGTVKAVGELLLPGGQRVKTVEIQSDGEMQPDPAIAPPKAEALSDLIEAARASGLVGLGGAGFPAHVKLTPNPGKPIDTLIVNGAECEPFITSDHREALENGADVMDGVYTLLRLTGVQRVIIAIEDNKPDAIQALYDIAASQRDTKHQVFVMPMKSRYPMGAEKVLVQNAAGREIPMGQLPADVGCLVMNITSVGFLARYLKTGMPLVSKRITVDGSAVGTPCNLRVPIGASIADVIAFCGGYREEPGKILMGGPMMGLALVDDSLPVLKQNNAILALAQRDCKPEKATACIRCGRCVAACPMGLMPTAAERQVKTGDASALEKAGVSACIECGSCAFSCPAKRPLVQSMRLAKEMVRKAASR